MKLKQEIERRRTFAIVSHPDAGKTTLTEKFLLFGGAINVAGAVKSNKIRKTATSDFMEIEKQRGISVATSVMGFEYGGKKINILDTPGHQDFAEDTFRTLTAADSVIIVIDAAKGVEVQTRKLMNVCRMRKTPVMVFVNKLDRPALDPFELLDEIEQQLEIKVHPLSWPVGMGRDFRGVYNRFDHTFRSFSGTNKQTIGKLIEFTDLEDPQFQKHITPYGEHLFEELELIDGVYPDFILKDYREGNTAPLFFGSALNNFGVKDLLDCFLQVAPAPGPIQTEERLVNPWEDKFSGFVFKIHANMDPNHRDRLAFIKIASGKFERNKGYTHVRSGRQIKFSSPTSFMAEKKSVIDEAYPGDIVGVHDTGNFKIGDSVTEGEQIRFNGIPSFSPELFRYVENDEPIKFKQLARGLDQLMDEGFSVYVFKEQYRSAKDTKYYKYLEAEHGFILKEYSPMFCKMEKIDTVSLLSNVTLKSDENCHPIRSIEDDSTDDFSYFTITVPVIFNEETGEFMKRTISLTQPLKYYFR